MKTNFREMLNTGKLKDFLGKDTFNVKEKKAIKNIKWCANDQWQFVNSWYDCKDETAKAYVMNADELFRTIYHDSLENEYGDGYVSFGKDAESFLKDVRFCGKEFLQKVTFYYVAKFLEDSVGEVEGTDEDAERVLADLKKLQKDLFGIGTEDRLEKTDLEATLSFICHDVQDGDKVIGAIAKYLNRPVKTTRKGENWVSLPMSLAIILSQYLIAKDSNLERRDTRTRIIFSNENVELTLNLGTNPYIWNTKGN